MSEYFSVFKNIRGNNEQTIITDASSLVDDNSVDASFIIITEKNVKMILHNHLKSSGYEYLSDGLIGLVCYGFCLYLVAHRRLTKELLDYFRIMTLYLWLEMFETGSYVIRFAVFEGNCSASRNSILFGDLLHFALNLALACIMQRAIMTTQDFKQDHRQTDTILNAADVRSKQHVAYVKLLFLSFSDQYKCEEGYAKGRVRVIHSNKCPYMRKTHENIYFRTYLNKPS